MSHEVRVAFVGLGGMGQGVHLRNFIHTQGCEVVAVCDARPQLAARVADAYHVPRHYSDHRRMLDEVESDAVVVIMGPPEHVPIALDCLAAGRHVFTEKPPATCLADVLRLADAARQSDRRFQVGFMKRCDGGMQLARERIAALDADREVGHRQFARVHYFCGNWTANYPWDLIQTDEPAPPRPPADMFPAPDFLPGEGPAFDFWFQQFCHGLNAVRYLWGAPTRVLHAHFPDWRGRGYEGVATMLIGEMPLSFEMGAFDNHRWDEHYELFYRGASVRVDATPPLLQQTPAAVRVYRQGEPAETRQLHAEWDWSFRQQVRHFLDVVRGYAACVSPIADTVHDVYLGEQIIRCAMEHRPIELDYPPVRFWP